MLSKFKAKKKKCPWILCFICLWRSEDDIWFFLWEATSSLNGRESYCSCPHFCNTLVSWKGPNPFLSSELSPSGNVVFWEMSRNRTLLAFLSAFLMLHNILISYGKVLLP